MLALLQLATGPLPFRQQPPHPGQHSISHEGFVEVVLYAVAQQLYPKFIVSFRREHYDGHVIEKTVSSQFLHHLLATHDGHHDVREDQIGRNCQRLFKTLTTVESAGDPVMLAECLGKERIHFRIIFDQQNAGPRKTRLSARPSADCFHKENYYIPRVQLAHCVGNIVEIST